MHTNNVNVAASESSKTWGSAGARDNYTQQFVQWAMQRSSGNAETILTNTSDEDVQKQRDGLVQEFFAEKLQGRVDGNYAQNAGSTGEGMGAPANIAGAQFGGANDSANQFIDAGVDRNNIRNDVANDVEVQRGVVNNKSDEASAGVERVKGETDSGIASRMGEYTSSANHFNDEKQAANKQQDDLLVNPFKNHTHKDYKGNGKG